MIGAWGRQVSQTAGMAGKSATARGHAECGARRPGAILGGGAEVSRRGDDAPVGQIASNCTERRHRGSSADSVLPIEPE